MNLIRGVREAIRIGMRRVTTRCHISGAMIIAFAALMASSVALAGDLDKVILFNIQAQALDKALLQFGAQAHMQISFAWDSSTAALRTDELKGSYTGREALARLLRGTRLSYFAVGDTVSIRDDGSKHSTTRASPSHQISPGVTTRGQSDSDPPVDDSAPQHDHAPMELEEVIVTAQKFSQRAFDVPLSLDVISARELEALRIRSLEDLQYDVPGLYMQQTGGLNRITLRGVGNGIGNGALVGEYIDEADITGEGDTGANGAATGDVQLNDVNRVEVLRGPQGTLYGDGSMGGVIRVITNRPVLDSFQMNADVAELLTQYGAPSEHTQAMLNVPLIIGQLGLRFAGNFEHDGGWIDEPEANLKNVNARNLTDVRLEGLWQPAPSLKIDAMQIIRRDSYGLAFGEDTQGNIQAPLVFGLTSKPNASQNFNLSNITITYGGRSVSLVSSSTYFTHSIYLHNAFFPELNAHGAVTSDVLIHYQEYPDENYSEELRLSNAADGAWGWMIGAFYKNYFDDDNQDAFETFPIPRAPVIQVSSIGTRTLSRSSSAFANTSYAVRPRLTIGAGVRYFTDHETFNIATTDYHGYAGLGVIPGKFEEHDFTSTDPRYFIQYQVAPEIMTYASASKGFRQGGFNAPGFPPYQSETLWSYDAGTKMRLWENRLQSDEDLFYGDYSNYVIEGLIPGIAEPYEANAGTAHIKGVDADLKLLLGRRWRVGVNAEYVDSEFADIKARNTGYVVGDRVPFVTQYSFNISAERDFRWRGKPGYAALYYSEVSPVQMRLVGYPVTQSDVMRFLNFSSSLDWSEFLKFGLFARNLLNDRGNLDPFWIQGEGSRPEPRTFGADFTVTFSGT